MRLRPTTVLAAVAVLVVTQTALARQLCLATVNACAPTCYEQRTAREHSSKWNPGSHTEPHPCCDESLTNKADQVLPAKGPTELNRKACAVAEDPAVEGHLAGGDALLLSRGNDPAPPFTHTNIYILNLNLRC